jgi:hypothetical protein
MAGILDSFSSDTCSHHNALRNITTGMYACGVTFRYKSDDGPNPFRDAYGAVSLQKCCDKVGAELMRIPGNSGCEMQFCSVSGVDSTRTFDRVDFIPTTLPNGDVTHTYGEPVASTEVVGGPPYEVDNCMRFVYEGELPDDVAEGVRDADSWCVVRMYDDLITGDDELQPEPVKQAPASWTEAAHDPLDDVFASMSSARANGGMPQETGGTGSSGSQHVSGWLSRVMLASAVLMASGALLC